jgi:hypothetical protein
VKRNQEEETMAFCKVSFDLLQILAPPGEYTIQLEKVDPAKLKMRNTRVDLGPAELIDSTTFRILECEQQNL